MAKATSVQAERIIELVSELQGELGQARALLLWFIEQHADVNGEVWIPWAEIARINRAMQQNYAPITVNGSWNQRNREDENEPGYMIIKANLRKLT